MYFMAGSIGCIASSAGTAASLYVLYCNVTTGTLTVALNAASTGLNTNVCYW